MTDLSVPRALAAAGQPFFATDWRKSNDGTPDDWTPPHKWQHTAPGPDSLSAVDSWTSDQALCMVTGHGLDVIDIDPRNGGSEQVLVDAGLWPSVVVAKSATPSGGVHLYVPSLGVASKANILPGVDIRSGVLKDGLLTSGGFVYTAPTQRKQGTYEWLIRPRESDLLDLELGLLEPDPNLRAHMDSLAPKGDASLGWYYDTTPYQELPHARQALADDHVLDTRIMWVSLLADAATWPDGKTDEQGRGWEALTRDYAWTLANLAAAPWSSVTEEQAEEWYHAGVPEDMTKDPRYQNKWRPGLVEKALERGDLTPPPWSQEALFDTTPELGYLRDYALTRNVAPMPLLGAVLARVVAEVPVGVCLPPASRSEGDIQQDIPVDASTGVSPNLGVVIVGRSGTGKSKSQGMSKTFLGGYVFHHQTGDRMISFGSGEGLIDMLQPDVVEDTETDDNPMPVVTYQSRLAWIDEVSTLQALSSRSGTTLTSVLKTAMMGEKLMSGNTKSGGNYREVPAHTYRLAAVINAQPMLTGFLLNTEEILSGTPQRFLWVPTHIPGASHEDAQDMVQQARQRYTSHPHSMDWTPPSDLVAPKPGYVRYVEYDDEVWNRVDRLDDVSNLIETKGVPDEATERVSALETHSRLTELKVAYALALLHGSTTVTQQWHDLAIEVVRGSTQQQLNSMSLVSEVNRRSLEYSVGERRRAERLAEQAEARTDSERLQQLAAETIKRYRKKGGGSTGCAPVLWRDVQPSARAMLGLKQAALRRECTSAETGVWSGRGPHNRISLHACDPQNPCNGDDIETFDED